MQFLKNKKRFYTAWTHKRTLHPEPPMSDASWWQVDQLEILADARKRAIETPLC